MRGEGRVKQSSFVGELTEFLKVGRGGGGGGGGGSRMKQGELQTQLVLTLCHTPKTDGT